MKFLSRILFTISVIALILYTFDFAEEYNKDLLYLLMTGFTGCFFTSFLGKNASKPLILRWLSALVVAGIVLYIFVFGTLWGLANRP
ncbi:hypothetical protein [Paenibacillus sp. FSL L8-0463]|uniref:hypothetical protein n=1 Tax=Paenibacillus sp. FSL L8-0463 TaxID=2954687 RepID=UPI00311A917A